MRNILSFFVFLMLGIISCKSDVSKSKRAEETPSKILGHGRTIAFIASEKDEHTGDLYILRSKDNEPQALTTDNKVTFDEPVWSPNGDKIAYKMGLTLAWMNSDGSNRKELNNIKVFDIPTWSPDGKLIAFSKYSDIRHYPLYHDISGDENAFR